MGYLPAQAQWMEPSALLETDQGDLPVAFRLPESSSDHAIGLIGGNVGDLTFLRRQYEDIVHFVDAYGTPGRLPDRPCGYDAFAALVFGEGAERMTDDEVRAIKTWAINGGTIVLPGGASAQMLSDVRWKGVLPVGSVTIRNVIGLPGIEKLGGSALSPNPVSLAIGSPTKDAEVLFSAHGDPVVVQRRFGFGKVVYLAFDPFEPPVKQWKGLNKLCANGLGIRDGLLNHAATNVEQFEDPYSSAGYDPFNAELPGAGTVFLILLLHFIFAVPLNFAFLRKLGKGDLAWITAPLISVAFAGVFFGLAFGLYKSGQSTRVRGTLIVSPDHDEAYFRGTAELFIPKGGTYDLKLQNVDYVESSALDYYDERPLADIELQDDGEIHMHDLRASNLSFHEFWFTQRVETAKWLQGSIRRSGDVLVCSLTNASPYDLRDMTVILGKKKYPLGDLARGGLLEVKATGTPLTDAGRFRMGEAAIVQADVRGFKPGPQIGADVGSKITMIFIWGKVQ